VPPKEREMNNQFGQPGKFALEMAKKRRAKIILIGVIMIALVVILSLLLNSHTVTIIGGTATLIIFIIFLLTPRITKLLVRKPGIEYKKWLRGAEGEETVGFLLSLLGEDYVINNDVKCAHGNIDHIVHDKSGNIFMIETKAHGGRVTARGDQLFLNGHSFIEKNVVRQAINNTFWLKEQIELSLRLEARVTAVLVFTNAEVYVNKPIRNMVYCIDKATLLDFIRGTRAASPAGLKLWEKRANALLKKPG
jgi:Holliday junction resolvase-like predicted endonuclease